MQEAANHVAPDAAEEHRGPTGMHTTQHNARIQLPPHGHDTAEGALCGSTLPARQHEARRDLDARTHSRTEPRE